MSMVRTFEVSILAAPGESADETRQRLLDALLAGGKATAKQGYFDFGIATEPTRESGDGFSAITTCHLTSSPGRLSRVTTESTGEIIGIAKDKIDGADLFDDPDQPVIVEGKANE